MNQITFLLLAACAAAISAKDIPSFSAQELQDLSEPVLKRLGQAYAEVGAISISGIPNDDYQKGLANLVKEAPECFTQSKDSIRMTYLEDSVARLTSATASSLPHLSKHPECVQTGSIQEAFDWTEQAVHKTISALLRYEPTFYAEDKPGAEKEIPLSLAPHLDHIHVYLKPPGIDDGPRIAKPMMRPMALKPTAPLHVDNGLFLIITPSPDHPLIVKDINGESLTVSDGDVAVLFGRAMQDWLLQTNPNSKIYKKEIFRAAPHEVPSILDMKQGDSRVVYARMVVVADEAVPRKGQGMKTFGQLFHNDNHDSSMNEHCPKSMDMFSVARDEMCGEGYAYCWMSCLELDANCEEDEQVCETLPDGDACCTGDQTSETDDCLDMDTTCYWHC